jgi:hypothetical protein
VLGVLSEVFSVIRRSGGSSPTGTVPKIAVHDDQQQRTLEWLRHADGQPVSFAELRARGVEFPAMVLSELELSGYTFERVRDQGRVAGVCLLEP